MSLTFLIIIGVISMLVSFYYRKNENINSQKRNENLIDKSKSSHAFNLESTISYNHALQNMRLLIKHNEENKCYFKSIEAINCSRIELMKSLNFLIDVIYFNKESEIYENWEQLNNLNELSMIVTVCYIDAKQNEIPTDLIENYFFGEKFETNKDLDLKQIMELKTITWRNKYHWSFWAKIYGETTPIGKFCLEQAKNE